MSEMEQSRFSRFSAPLRHLLVRILAPNVWKNASGGILSGERYPSYLSENPIRNAASVVKEHVRIGKYCSIAKGAMICFNYNHRPDFLSTYDFIESMNQSVDKDVVIGNDVWIGDNALILDGVHIGDGAVIGAGAVVTKDVEPYCIVVGNPAHLIRKRFSPEVIRELLRIKWWDWSAEEIRSNIPVLCSSNVEKLSKS